MQDSRGSFPNLKKSQKNQKNNLKTRKLFFTFGHTHVMITPLAKRLANENTRSSVEGESCMNSTPPAPTWLKGKIFYKGGKHNDPEGQED